MKKIKLKINDTRIDNIVYYGLEFKLNTKLWKYIAMNKNGDIFCYNGKPEFLDSIGAWTYDMTGKIKRKYIANIFIDFFEESYSGFHKIDVFIANDIDRNLLPVSIIFRQTLANQKYSKNKEKIDNGTYEDYILEVEDWKSTLKLLDHE